MQREREKQTPGWAERLMQGSIPGLQDHDLSQRQALNQLSHPGALGFLFLFFKILFFLHNLYTQCGAQPHNPRIKCHMFHRLSQSGAPDLGIFKSFLGCLGASVNWVSAFSSDWVPHRASCSVGSLLLPQPASPPACALFLCLSDK